MASWEQVIIVHICMIFTQLKIHIKYECSLQRKQISSVGELSEQCWQWSHVLFVSFLIYPVLFCFLLLSFHRADQNTHQSQQILILECISLGDLYQFGNCFVKVETANIDDGPVQRFLALIFGADDGGV